MKQALQFPSGRIRLFLLAILLAMPAASAQSPVVEVLPLGDSITRGYNNINYPNGDIPGGYRREFANRLNTAGVTFDLVGTQTDNAASAMDPDHSGMNGFRTDQMLAALPASLALAPDIVLLHLGTSDILQSIPVATAAGNINTLIGQIVSAAPNRRLYVSTIIPFATTDWQVSPFIPANNVQGTGPTDRYDALRGTDASLMAAPEAAVRQIVSELKEFDNIYFEVLNEPFWNEPGIKDDQEIAFQNRMHQIIRETEATLLNQHLVAHNFPQQADAMSPGFGVINEHYPLAVTLQEPDPTIAGAEALLRDHYQRDRILALDETNTDTTLQTRLESWMFLLGGGGIYNGLDVPYFVYSVNDETGDSELGRSFRNGVNNIGSYMDSLHLVALRRDFTWVTGGIPTGATLQAMASPGQQYVAYFHHGQRDVPGRLSYDLIDGSNHVITPTTAGTTWHYAITAVDLNGNESIASSEIAITSTPDNLPFGGAAWPLPGRIEVENFDTGGEGVAFHDLTAGNEGGQYRPSENVDIAATTDEGGGYHVSGTEAGEWMEFSVHMASAGGFIPALRTANANAGGEIRLEVDGTDISGLIQLLVTDVNNLQNFDDIMVNVIPSSFVNSSFESGYAGWTTSGNQNIQSALPYTATDGSKLVAFNSGNTTPNGVLSQTFATIPGVTYLLSFDMGVLSYNTNEQRMLVDVNGSASLISETFSLSGLGGGTTRWQAKSIIFTADSSATTLTFRDRSTVTNSLDLVLDNVRITPRITRILSVNSLPNTGITITVSPADANGASGGATNFIRGYQDATVVRLVAPAATGTFRFQKWLKNAAIFSNSCAINVTMDGDQTLTAVYAEGAPLITSQPTGLTIAVGGTATFRVIAEGTTTLSYQWRYNSNNITGATLSSYTINNARADQTGNYDVVVSNTAGSSISDLAVLTVLQGPTPATTPSATQQVQINRKYGMFCHFGINTFANQEWTDGTLPATTFAPTAVDADQWVQTAKAAGMRYLLLTTKHHDGFCLWNSQWTTYDVASSSVPNIDVVRLVSDACARNGISFAMYYSLWDRHEPSYNSANFNDYVTYMKRQLTELMSNYGPVAELWLDGGWQTPNSAWNIPELYNLVKTLQPGCQVTVNLTIGQPGNPDAASVKPLLQETGYPSRYFPVDFRTYDPEMPKFPDPKVFTNNGNNYYLPFEATVTIAANNNWFFNTSDTSAKSLTFLEKTFNTATAQNNLLVLNAAPNRNGVLIPSNVAALTGLSSRLGLEPGKPFPVNFANNATITAKSTWATAGFEAPKACDENPDTRWSAAAGDLSPWLEVAFAASTRFDRVIVNEYGEGNVYRCTSFVLQAWNGSAWYTIHTGTTATLTFRDQSTATNAVDLQLDNVRVASAPAAAPASATAFVPPSPAPEPSAIAPVAIPPDTPSLSGTPGDFTIVMTASRAGSYVLERSQDLKTWVRISRMEITEPGLVEFHDQTTSAALEPAKASVFYRIGLLPDLGD